jgi:hypothetical protein
VVNFVYDYFRGVGTQSNPSSKDKALPYSALKGSLLTPHHVPILSPFKSITFSLSVHSCDDKAPSETEHENTKYFFALTIQLKCLLIFSL